MPKYFLNEKETEFKQGERLSDAAKLIQKDFKYDIVLFEADGKIKELHTPIKENMRLVPITADTPIGRDCCRRSTVFLMMKAIYDVAGIDRIEKVQVLYNIGSSLFVEVSGDVNADADFAQRVEKRMKEYAAEDIEIKKRVMATDDAITLFEGYKMYDKSRLFEFRSASTVNVYSIGGFDDYYFGAMVSSTGYIKHFSVTPYEGGLTLNLPNKNNPDKVGEFVPKPKIFRALREASSDLKKMGVETVADLNNKIVKGELPELIVTQETLMERKIAQIADKIAGKPNCRFILIAGPSSSGKTTFSRRLSIQLRSLGLKAHPISLDDYFRNYDEIPLDENGDPDRENISAVDTDLFRNNMEALLRGERIEAPHYNFKVRKREFNGNFIQMGDNDVFVIEGIHGLNGLLSDFMPEDAKFKIYISPLTQLNIDERNRVPTTDGRLIRRIVRDARTRGTDAKTTISWWPGVRRGEEKNIFPYQEDADIIFNSSLVYELAALKVWAEPLLYAVPKDCPERIEAKRLLKFFNYFLAVDNDNIPATSLVREFIGGSCFEVG